MCLTLKSEYFLRLIAINRLALKMGKLSQGPHAQYFSLFKGLSQSATKVRRYRMREDLKKVLNSFSLVDKNGVDLPERSETLQYF